MSTNPYGNFPSYAERKYLSDLHAWRRYASFPAAAAQFQIAEGCETAEEYWVGDMDDWEEAVNFLLNVAGLPLEKFPKHFSNVFDYMTRDVKSFPAFELNKRFYNAAFERAARGTRIYNVRGNHNAPDELLDGYEFKGIHIVKNARINTGYETVLVVHGDEFDPHKMGTEKHGRYKGKNILGYKSGTEILVRVMKIDRLLEERPALKEKIFRHLHNGLERLPEFRKKVALSLSDSTMLANFFTSLGSTDHSRLWPFRFTTMVSEFRAAAVQYAKDMDVDAILCGHIHREDNVIEDGIRYLNSGDGLTNGTGIIQNGPFWRVIRATDLNPAKTPSLSGPDPNHRHAAKTAILLQEKWQATLQYLDETLELNKGILDPLRPFTRPASSPIQAVRDPDMELAA